jgi:hypothetical protein
VIDVLIRGCLNSGKMADRDLKHGPNTDIF